jgi:hypothetical protein
MTINPNDGARLDALTKIDALVKGSRTNTDDLPEDSVNPYDKGWDDATSSILDKLTPLVAEGLADAPAKEGNWVFQEILRTEEALDAVPDGVTIRTERPRGSGSIYFEKFGRGFLALDPGDRNDGEELVSTGALLRWMSTGFAVVVDVPGTGRNGDAPGVNL